MDASVRWHGGLSFSGAAETGFDVPLGAAPEVGGANDGFRPMELMAVSLAGCTAMDVISVLRKKRQEVTAFEVRVKAQRAEEHPKVFTGATIEYEVTGRGVQEAAVEVLLDEVSNDFRVGFRLELVARGGKLLAKLAVVLDYTVVYDGEPVGAAEVGVRVMVAGLSVSRPARMAYAARAFFDFLSYCKLD